MAISNNGRRFSPPASGAAKPTGGARPATGGKPAGKPAAKAAADLDLIACDNEFAEVELEVRDVPGKGEMEVWKRAGALWLGRKRDDGQMGTPFCLIGVEGASERTAAKLFVEQEGDEGVLYTLRAVEGKGRDQKAVKGEKGKLGEVFWPTGGQPQFSFTKGGAEASGCEFAKGVVRKAKR